MYGGDGLGLSRQYIALTEHFDAECECVER